MNIGNLPLGFQEQVSFSLRSLYSRYGYIQYKMSKFEEYDLYARNKDFLISDGVITFMDRSGKLLALKPDVTLSIVKNSKDAPAQLQKLYYHENVYRAAKSTRSFKEIMQVGLECLGNVDDYCILEVLMLAAESLRCISTHMVLDISHLGLLLDLIDAVGIPAGKKKEILSCIGAKNTHELVSLCRQWEVCESQIEILKQAVEICGAPEDVLPRLTALLTGIVDTTPLKKLAAITDALESGGIRDMLRFDFSVVDDTHYYNGLVFKGFVQGLPSSVLSGGQYDKLMQKMGRKSRAIGFAVYLDTLERLDREKVDCDVDTLLLYDAHTPLAAIRDQVEQIRLQNRSVLVQQRIPEDLRFRQIIQISGNEV